MAKIKNVIQSTLGKSASSLPVSALLKLTKQNAILPFYHSISDQPLAHIKHLYQVKSSKEFSADLDFLLQHFEPVDLKRFLELKSNPSKIQKPYFLLSFDDGLREVKEVIAPILKAKGIPAVCFLNSEFVDNEALFFRYKASLLLEEVSKSNSVRNAAKDFFQTEDAVATLLAIRHNEQEQLNQFANYIGYSFTDFLKNEQPYLNKAEILDLKQQGFDFGAHSANHPEYQYLPLEEQLWQTEESLNYLKKEIGVELLSFSFPFTDFGVTKEFFTALNQAEQIAATFGCAGMKEDSVANHFQRIAFEEKGHTGKELLHAEMLYYLMKQPVGKNKINRS
jgi:peptidoglycan/xylan/chitin deacetylase (PgdA/CDA1 family)